MEIEDVVGIKFGIENEADMEDGNRGWNLKDIAGDSLTMAPFPYARKPNTTLEAGRRFWWESDATVAGTLTQRVRAGRCSGWSWRRVLVEGQAPGSSSATRIVDRVG
jgi:hypothetical protein